MEEDLSKRLEQVFEEARQLNLELLETLGEMPKTIEEGEAWQTWTRRWEQIEMVVSALQMCQYLLQDRETEGITIFCRGLRRWRRLEGGEASGWIEVRTVKGHGPYVYYRWRQPGEDQIQTRYYGRIKDVRNHLMRNLYQAGEE